jgi:hypothetical protein
LRCSTAGLGEREDSEGSGELLRLEALLRAGEGEVEAGCCRSMLRSGSAAAAGAGLPAFLAMARGKAHASEIDGWPGRGLEADSIMQKSLRSRYSTAATVDEAYTVRDGSYKTKMHRPLQVSGLLLVARVNTALRQLCVSTLPGHACARSRRK